MVDQFNDSVYNSTHADKVCVFANDRVVEAATDVMKDRISKSIQGDAKPFAGLSKTVHVAVALLYDISANISVDDAYLDFCFLMHIDYRVAASKVPTLLWVKLFDPDFGKQVKIVPELLQTRYRQIMGPNIRRPT